MCRAAFGGGDLARGQPTREAGPDVKQQDGGVPARDSQRTIYFRSTGLYGLSISLRITGVVLFVHNALLSAFFLSSLFTSSGPAFTSGLACLPHHLTGEARDKTAMTSLFLRSACLPCSMYCQVHLRAPSGSRLVLTALSRTSPRHGVRNTGQSFLTALSVQQ